MIFYFIQNDYQRHSHAACPATSKQQTPGQLLCVEVLYLVFIMVAATFLALSCYINKHAQKKWDEYITSGVNLNL